MLSRIVNISKDFAKIASVGTACYALYYSGQTCNSIAIIRAAELVALNHFDLRRMPFQGIMGCLNIVGCGLFVCWADFVLYHALYNGLNTSYSCYNDISYLTSSAIVVSPTILIKALLDFEEWCDRDIEVDLNEPILFV